MSTFILSTGAHIVLFPWRFFYKVFLYQQRHLYQKVTGMTFKLFIFLEFYTLKSQCLLCVLIWFILSLTCFAVGFGLHYLSHDLTKLCWRKICCTWADGLGFWRMNCLRKGYFVQHFFMNVKINFNIYILLLKVFSIRKHSIMETICLVLGFNMLD